MTHFSHVTITNLHEQEKGDFSLISCQFHHFLDDHGFSICRTIIIYLISIYKLLLNQVQREILLAQPESWRLSPKSGDLASMHTGFKSV